MGRKTLRLNVIMVLVMLLLAMGGPFAVSADEPPPVQDLTNVEVPDHSLPKLDSSLSQLIKSKTTGQVASLAQQLNLDVTDDRARVVIETLPGKAGQAAALARSLGAEVEASYEDMVQITAPLDALTSLADSNLVAVVRQPFKPVTCAVSEGVHLINADAYQANGYNGAGTRVGILDIGFSGYTSRLGTDLPASITYWAPGGSSDTGTISHGTICAELVYDMAPGADFYLARYSTDVEYLNAVDWLISQHVNVISHSCVWLYNGPGNGTGYICDAIARARNAGITWVQSAGNYELSHWAGVYTDNARNNWHDFSSSPLNEIDAFYAYSGEVMTAMLRWNDAWGTSANDYDLYLFQWTGSAWQVIAASTYRQNGHVYPAEYIRGTISATGWYALAIRKVSATRAPYMEIIVHKEQYLAQLNYRVTGGSLSVPADSRNAISVGAVNWDTPDVITSYSSRGPTRDNRVKPDVVGPDKVTVSTGVFQGTSAATAHVAGAALLVKQMSPAMTPAQIQTYLETNAVHLGITGKNNIYGSGRVRLPSFFPPANLVAKPVSSTQIDLSWQGTGDETGFKIWRKKGTGAYSQIGTTTAGVTTYSSTKLTAGTTYSYQVQSCYGKVNSPGSQPATATTLPLPPNPPRLSLPKTGAKDVPLTPLLDWDEPAGATTYSVQVSTTSDFASTIVDETYLMGSSYPVPEGILSYNTRYYWRANAINSSNSPSRWSTPGNFTTAGGPAPDAPTNLVAESNSSTHVDLRWDDNSSNEAGFVIERKTGTANFTKVASVKSNVTTYVDNSTTLAANTFYTYRIKAYSGTLNSAYSNEGSATTAATIKLMDYSFARPDPAKIKSSGFNGVLRYLAPSSWKSGKVITAEECNNLRSAGLAIGLIWESTATRAQEGSSAGTEDATDALSQANSLGFPDSLPIYFCVQDDGNTKTEAQIKKIEEYLNAIRDKFGSRKIGAYGGYAIIKRLFDDAVIDYGWQTYAWSYQKWDYRAQLRQTLNDQWNKQVDYDIATTEDWGGWPPP